MSKELDNSIYDIMIEEALLALFDFRKTGSRDGFKKWQEKWKKELDLISKEEVL